MKLYKSIICICLAALPLLISCEKQQEELSEPLNLVLRIKNITQTGADLSVTPSDENQTYYADVAAAEKFSGMDDKQIISEIIKSYKVEDLKKGSVIFEGKDMNLEPNKRYVFFAVGIKESQPATRLFKTYFSTLEEEAQGDSIQEFTKTDGRLNPITNEGFRHFIWDYKTYPDNFAFRGERPAIVDYWASWCGYCMQMMPLMEQLAQEYKGRVDFFKIDTDHDNGLSDFLGITSLPCFYFYPKKGEPLVRVGSMDLYSMRKIIEEVLLVSQNENPDAEKPDLEINVWKGDVNHEWTDRKITATIKCVSNNAQLVKIGCFLKRDFESGLSDKDMVHNYGEVLEESLLQEVNSSLGTTVSFNVKKGEQYKFVCSVMNSEGGIIVKSMDVSTDDIYVPFIDFQVSRGAIEDNIKDNTQYLTYYIKSPDAVSISYACVKKVDYDALLKSGETINDIVKSQGISLNDAQFSEAKSIGHIAVVGGLEESTVYVCLVSAVDSKGKAFTSYLEETTVFSGYNQVIPLPSVILVTSLIENSMSCSVNCSSSDAIYASLLMIKSDELAKLLSDGATLESIMESHKDVNAFSAQQMEWVNGQGVSNVLSNIEPSTRYTWITDIRGKFGGRVVKRSEVKTLPNGETPAIEIIVNSNYSQGLITASASCPTANASKANAAFIESIDLEKLLASGQTLENIMTEHRTEFINYEELTTEQIEFLNTNGFVLGCTGIKPSTRYACIVDAYTSSDDRAVMRSEVQTPKHLNDITYQCCDKLVQKPTPKTRIHSYENIDLNKPANKVCLKEQKSKRRICRLPGKFL